MREIELLPLRYEYCEKVAEIAKESLPEHWSLQSIRDVLRYDNNIYYVAYSIEENQIIGFAGVMVIADEAELLNIAICQAFRGQGIGKLLLEKMLQVTVEQGACRLLLEVRQSNLVARALYDRYCFREIARRKDYYSNPTEDAVILEWSNEQLLPLEITNELGYHSNMMERL